MKPKRIILIRHGESVQFKADDLPTGTYLVSFSSESIQQFGKILVVK